MSAAQDKVFEAAGLNDGSSRFYVLRAALDAYKAEIQREAAATVRAQAPKYLDNEVDQAIFYALDKAAGEIDPDKETGT